MAAVTLARSIEDLIEDLAEELQVPRSRYEAAERSYRSVGAWLQRPDSSLRHATPQVYIQGSFRLGTVIKPIFETEDYDLDIVCELVVSKASKSQAELKKMLGDEMIAYAKRYNMAPPEEGRRCWTLAYADGAQFHLDALPSVPDGARKRQILEAVAMSATWAGTAIAITDKEHPRYRQITLDWLHSNPKGYALWFQSRMAPIFEARRHAIALAARRRVEDIPEYDVRTPLQTAVQILKRHRDVAFVDNPDDKPISIIITTLAAHAYRQQATVAEALYDILTRMDTFIENRNGISWIANPTDPQENFADRWATHPDRQKAFYDWLAQARRDFSAAAMAPSKALAAAALKRGMGEQLVESAASRRGLGSSISSAMRNAGTIALTVLNPSYRKAPPWTPAVLGTVKIDKAVVKQNGYRDREYQSGSATLPKRCDLVFHAKTDIPWPYKVYWQVVNTGAEAARMKGGLRGGFDEGFIEGGWLKRNESTSYTGTHSIECFIVKNGYLAARSGQFLVRIQ